MNSDEREEIYDLAWNHWGADTQLDMLIEEMAELTQALLKGRRNGVTFSYAVAEEVADVCICIEQVRTRMKKIPYDVNAHGVEKNMWDDQVMEIHAQKLERLKDRLIKSVEEEIAIMATR